MSHQSYNSVHHSIMDYISQNCTDHNYGIMIRDLCYYRYSYYIYIYIYNSTRSIEKYNNHSDNKKMCSYNQQK